MLKRCALVCYTAMALAYLGLAFHVFCIQRTGLRGTALQKLRRRTLEIVAGEVYAYYLTMHGIAYRTQRSAYIYALQYFYYVGQLAYEESRFCRLLSICMAMSAVKCIFVIYVVRDGYLAPMDHGLQVVGFPLYISTKIGELRDAVRSTLYFIWIGSVYSILHGCRGLESAVLILMLVVSDVVRSARMPYSTLVLVVEGVVFLAAVYLESGILMREKDPAHAIIVVNKIVLLFGDILLSVVANMIESTGLLSGAAQQEPDATRRNKLPKM